MTFLLFYSESKTENDTLAPCSHDALNGLSFQILAKCGNSRVKWFDLYSPGLLVQCSIFSRQKLHPGRMASSCCWPAMYSVENDEMRISTGS